MFALLIPSRPTPLSGLYVEHTSSRSLYHVQKTEIRVVTKVIGPRKSLLFY